MKKAEQANFPEFEAEMLKVWDTEKTFEQSLANREDGERFSFYDGPPFANGLPHYGHVVALTEKDAITRYKTMRGYYVPRRNGWDTHGLPVEIEVEKQLGISGKRQIMEMGVDKFNEAAKSSVFKYKQEWEDFMRRLGRWSDQENSYATLDDNYIESVWWVMSQLHKKGLVYRGFRSSPYCPRCATPLSNFEVNQNYKDDVSDPSVFVKFELTDHPGEHFLAWTTTPWTLPANAALAVSADADYVKVEMLDDGDGWANGDQLILAKARLEVLDLRKAEYKQLGTMKGSELAGWSYKPLYAVSNQSHEMTKAWYVHTDPSVSLEDGTGVLHVAPRYGETDLALGLEKHLPLLESVDAFGNISSDIKISAGTMFSPEQKKSDEKFLSSIAGMFFKKADPHIIADLTKKGRIFAAETFTHTYPFCWRCETPLMYFALPSWYVEVSKLRDKLVKNNNEVNWVPDHIKQGRFGNWLADARDWNFSRNRFWGAPIPIWVNEQDSGDIIVVSSLDELRQLSGHKGDFELHRPGIDEIVIKRDGKTYKRTEEVFDCWFESGAMPYAQDHWMGGKSGSDMPPHFPAQFIAEGLDQTRGWFYTLHVLGTALYDTPAFQNVVVNGLVLAADGKKLSKRLRNYPDPAEIFASAGADSLRFFLMSSPVVAGEDVRFSAEAVGEVSRNVFMRLWNVYSFFSTYAEVDKWQPDRELVEPKSDNVLDQWLLSSLNQTIIDITKSAEEYRIAQTLRPLREFIDDLSNWYVRLSRRRFWKSEDDDDKQSAYATLHYVLVRVSQLLAPTSPFASDKIWRELTAGVDLPQSVHLSDWPDVIKVHSWADAEKEVHRLAEDLRNIQSMRVVRDIVNNGLALRAEAGIKVRQPLQRLKIHSKQLIDERLISLITGEVNVKKVEQVIGGELQVELDTKITPALAREGMMRDIVRHVQKVRKQMDLNVDDRIVLSLVSTDPEVQKAIEEHQQTIEAETLATYGKVDEKSEPVPVKVGDGELLIHLEKPAK